MINVLADAVRVCSSEMMPVFSFGEGQKGSLGLPHKDTRSAHKSPALVPTCSDQSTGD